MNVMIFADMEGVAGIQSWEHVSGESQAYQMGRRLYTGEVNAAVRGCKAAGATSIVAVDGHGGGYTGGKPFMSWNNDQLESGAEYVQGYAWARYVEPFVESCDCIVLVGAHAMAGVSDGVLSHTVSSETWKSATINGTLVGESGLIAAVAGSFGVPIIFVSGDAATCREVKSLVGESVVEAPVKTGLARFAARNMSHSDACKLIEEKIASALIHPENWPAPTFFEPPIMFRVELATPDRAAAFYGRKGVELVGPQTVEVTSDVNFYEAWDRFWYRS